MKNKAPPQRIRVAFSDGGIVKKTETMPLEHLDLNYQWGKPWTEHFYTLEKPMKLEDFKKEMEEENRKLAKINQEKLAAMTHKTENLTKEEAWAALGRGECVKACDFVHRIRSNTLEFFNGEKWLAICELSADPYSIVPDPSKPKEVEDEYNKDLGELLDMIINGKASLEKTLIKMTEFNNKYYQRKP